MRRQTKSLDMEDIPISKFMATCLALLHKVKRTGKPILVSRKGQPIARVIPPPLPAQPPSWLGLFASSAAILGDITSPAGTSEDWDALRA